MIVTQEDQIKLLKKYLETHTAQEGSGYVDGINDIIKLINNKTKEK